MTSLFDENGNNIPCTIIEAGPCVITQIKTPDKEGYTAFQIGWGEKKEKHTSKAAQGHFAKAGTSSKKVVVEVRDPRIDRQVGETIDVTIFKEGEYVDVVGTTKGKGFQGVVKRHGFSGVGQATHGQHDRLRAPGSIGASSYPSRVFKGMRMAGQMGNKRVKEINLLIVKIIQDQNIIVVKGAIPGYNGSTVILEK